MVKMTRFILVFMGYTLASVTGVTATMQQSPVTPTPDDLAIKLRYQHYQVQVSDIEVEGRRIAETLDSAWDFVRNIEKTVLFSSSLLVAETWKKQVETFDLNFQTLNSKCLDYIEKSTRCLDLLKEQSDLDLAKVLKELRKVESLEEDGCQKRISSLRLLREDVEKRGYQIGELRDLTRRRSMSLRRIGESLHRLLEDLSLE